MLQQPSPSHKKDFKKEFRGKYRINIIVLQDQPREQPLENR